MNLRGAFGEASKALASPADTASKKGVLDLEAP
jgi:hypothetical protein